MACVEFRFRNSLITCVRLFLIITLLSQSLADNYHQCGLKYRSRDGSCNNIKHPHWGASNSPYLKLLPPANDEYLRNLFPAESVSSQILSRLPALGTSSTVPRSGIFQLWTDVLIMDLDMPISENDSKNTATAYLDASFLYGSVNFTDRTVSGNIIYRPCSNCKNMSAITKTALLLLINEHNRIADLLRRKYIRWDSETVYEESKRILIAEIQHITYTQYLPLLIGEISHTLNVDQDQNLLYTPTLYAKETETGLYQTTSNIVFKLIKDFYFKDNSHLNSTLENSLKLFLLRLAPDFDKFPNADTIENILLLNRRHKTNSYEEFKQLCLAENKIRKFYSSQLSENQNNVDLNSFVTGAELLTGILLEDRRVRGLFGPTFACLISLQFENIKTGDRFWYTNENLNSSFTSEELTTLQKFTISDLICLNTPNLKNIQRNAFLAYDSELNPSGSCTRTLPSAFSNWRKSNFDSESSNVQLLKDAVRKAELDVDRRQQTEFLLWSNKGGVDPKSAAGTAAAFSKPNRVALLMANNSILFEYASNELLSSINRRSTLKRRRRQIFTADETPVISITEDLAGNYLQDIDIHSMLPSISEDSNGSCPPETNACDASYPYRSISGYCNNLHKPNYGKCLTTFPRLLPPSYENGVSKPRVHSSVSKEISLPSARLVSAVMHVDVSHLDAKHSMMLMQFAQFVDHDITFTPVHRGFFTSIPDCRSCDSSHTVHPECMPIEIPVGDSFYPQVNFTTGKPLCLPFMRSLPGQQRFGPREQLNQNSAFLDASQVYGDTACLARKLRNFYRGRLNTTISLYGDKELLPQSPVHPECRAASGYCFIAGDGRASEQPGLTALHTSFVREHNRLTDGLRSLNSHWNDEKLYQEARKILGAQYQHILYNEFLPRILGLTAMELYEISLEPPGQYHEEYVKECNPGAFTEFATAAFRIGHSLLRPFIPRVNPAFQPVEPFILLRDSFFNPDIIYQRHMVDEIIRGLYSTPVEELDQFITKEITNRLFEDKKIPHSGIDLIALNVQRGRDHAIGSYNDYRARCNLRRATVWEDFSRELPSDVIARLRRIYVDVNDVDLFPAGISERPIPGGMVGPTFACIIGLQFRQLRNCDRFWYETSNPIIKFSQEQLAEIRKASLAKILCDNMDVPSSIQRYAMDMPDDITNPRISCHSLPEINLHAWKDSSHFCHFRGLIMNVGETSIPSPCTSCICTPQDMKCASIRVTNCIKLLQEVGESEVLKDEVCAAQCSAYVSSTRQISSQSHGSNYYLGLKPPRAINVRRKFPSLRNLRAQDYSILVG